MSTMLFTFLMCSERSGSNLLTSLMGGHSAVCAPPPSHLFRLFGSNAGNYGDLARDENWEILLADVIGGFENQLGVWITRPTIEFLRVNARARTAAAPLRLIYEQEARQKGAAHVFVKENHTAAFADFLIAHFTPCRFVWMVRDPRDVAASYLHTDGIPGGVAKAVEVWKHDQLENLGLHDRLRESGAVLFLKYEDLIAKPAAELERIAGFMGLLFEPEMLLSNEREQVQKNAVKIEAWQNLAKPILTQNAGKFVAGLTSEEIEYVELVCFDEMRALGYPFHSVAADTAEPDRIRRAAELSPRLREGQYRVAGDAEQETRRRRLAAVNTVLARKLT